MKKKILTVLIILVVISLGIAALVLVANHQVVSVAGKYVLDIEDVPNAEYVIVLGAKAYDNDTPSPVLRERLDAAIKLYNIERVKSFFLTGYEDTDKDREITTMKNYVAEKLKIDDIGKYLNDRIIVLDGESKNTVASIKTMASIINHDPQKVIIVTQEFHIHRAVYLARSLGIEAYGLVAKDPVGLDTASLNMRELFARTKDFVLMLFE